MREPPRNILLLKSHSAGIGDLLRSSACWQSLHDAFPGVALHLAFLSNDPGYASEELIARHHLLRSFFVRRKWPNTPAQWLAGARWFLEIVRSTGADLLIDFETSGIRTALLSCLARRWSGLETVGVAEIPARGWFYHRPAPSRAHYARQHHQSLPLNYTERDFVALGALGIERNGRAIQLRESPEAVAYRQRLRDQLQLEQGVPLVGINLGCGTPGAIDRRPDPTLMRALLEWLQREQGCAVVLTGAPYEYAVNQELLRGYSPPPLLPVLNLAGLTRLIELPGVLSACSLFISADSGPYHMAVALRVPTLAIFNFELPEAYHAHPWVRCVVAPDSNQLHRVQIAAKELIIHRTPAPVPAHFNA